MAKAIFSVVDPKLSATSKLHCRSFGLECERWAWNNRLPVNHPCRWCYAATGNTRQHKVRDVLRHNSAIICGITRAVDTVAKDIAYHIGHDRYFRWHHAGTLTSVRHYDIIRRTCELTPATLHWLPVTPETLCYITGKKPSNLTIRVSGTVIDGVAPKGGTVVYTKVCPKGHFKCPGECGVKDTDYCRVCWETKRRVGYKIHFDAIVTREARKAGLDV